MAVDVYVPSIVEVVGVRRKLEATAWNLLDFGGTRSKCNNVGRSTVYLMKIKIIHLLTFVRVDGSTANATHMIMFHLVIISEC